MELMIFNYSCKCFKMIKESNHKWFRLSKAAKTFSTEYYQECFHLIGPPNSIQEKIYNFLRAPTLMHITTLYCMLCAFWKVHEYYNDNISWVILTLVITSIHLWASWNASSQLTEDCWRHSITTPITAEKSSKEKNMSINPLRCLLKKNWWKYD